MRTLRNIFKYIGTFLFVLIILLISDFVLLFMMTSSTSDFNTYVPVGKISKTLSINENGEYIFSDEGVNLLEKYYTFAMYIDENGDVKWEYNLPDDVPKHYSIQQVASFTRWYLNDYPVYTWAYDKGLFVAGRSKNSIWKFSLEYSLDAMELYISYVPIIILINLIIFFTVPTIVIKRQLRRKEKERTEWIAGISHDIRTPLSLVLGNASAIKNMSQDNNEEIEQRAAKIEKEVLGISTKIANLNMENKLTYGMGKWNKEKILLCSLIRDTLCDIINGGVGEQYDFDINIEETTENFTVIGDRELIKRMIENLVYNSINHNPQGCKITVSVEKYKSNHCRLTIKDNGCGVTREQLKSFRKPLLTSKQIPEHGLGIRLVRQIVSVHKWKAWFENDVNGGLVCRVIVK